MVVRLASANASLAPAMSDVRKVRARYAASRVSRRPGSPKGAIHTRGIAFEGPLKRRAIRKDTRQRVELDEHARTGQVGLRFPQDETARDG